jgi:hypothetical protein
MNQKLFYKELGCLMYALAAVDGAVKPKEMTTLKRIVHDQLVPFEPGSDKYGTDNAFITEFEFDVLADQVADPQDCFDSFVAYISQHRKEVTPQRRELIYSMADAVASAFHGVNKKELVLLNELHRELEVHERSVG